MSKQSILMGQLLRKKTQMISEYKQRQERYKNQIEGHQRQCEQLNSLIVNECKNLRTSTDSLKSKVKQFIQNCVNSLEDEKKNAQIISIKELAGYLKTEKQMLVKISESQQRQVTTDLDIHQIISKSKFQQTLRKLKKFQLQQEIKYLENNVLVKNSIIYNAATSILILPAEEKQINLKLESLIRQLQRVISLSIPCIDQVDESDKLHQLQMQAKRLSQCDALLVSENQKLKKVMSIFQSQCHTIFDQFSSVAVQQNTKDAQIKENYNQKRILEQQLDQIIQFDTKKCSLIGRLNHKFDDCEEKITQLRKIFKKCQLMM